MIKKNQARGLSKKESKLLGINQYNKGEACYGFSNLFSTNVKRSDQIPLFDGINNRPENRQGCNCKV